jgi:dihydropteroate synthase
MIEVALATDVPIIIMHMQGTPADMQDRPQYEDVIDEILAFFSERIGWMTARGIDAQRIILDPGIGFGKTVEHNLSIIKHLDRFKILGQQILLGHSRKSFIGKITGQKEQQRDLPTAVISALAGQQGIDIVRVHDVASSRLALQISTAILRAK